MPSLRTDIQWSDIKAKLGTSQNAYIAIILLTVFLLWLLVTRVSVISHIVLTPAVSPVPPSTLASHQFYAKLIPPAHLFGFYQTVDNLRDTDLNLQLQGVLFATPLARSQALIAAPGAELKSYELGDSVPGGAIIDSFLPDGVILKRNGDLEKLPLKRPVLEWQSVPEDTVSVSP